MTFSNFCRKADVHSMQELDKIAAIGFYLFRKENFVEFTMPVLSQRLVTEGFSKPNESRLRDKMVKSKFIIRVKPGCYRWHSNLIKTMDIKYDYLNETSEEIETSNSILPQNLYSNTRGYIEKLAKQINCAYENNICDGCTVLMRRLLEILLILGYSAKGKEAEIQRGDGYKNLSLIIDYTISTKSLPLQKDTLEVLHDFRELGNFSAHAIHYNCHKEEISRIARRYRVTIEDLLYACEIKK